VFPLDPEVKVIAGAVLCAALIGGAWALASHFEGIGYARAKAEQVTADAAANAKNRKTEQDLADAKQEIVDVQAAHQVQVTSVRAALTADADRVRGQLTGALSGRGAAQDSLAACQQRGSDAGDLLADGLRVQIDLASKAESLAGAARAVRDFNAKVKAAGQ
jgi:hypothetical protein